MSLPLNILVFFAFYVLSSISGATIDLKHFDDKVIKDSTVWLVEFFSPMCGSCNDFAPTWTKLEKASKSVMTTKVNIDEKEGMQIAQRLGVLEEGLPNIRLFNGKSTVGTSILQGDSTLVDYKKLLKKIKDSLKGLQKNENGVYVKN